ncbi:helix-turn-helix transcriptional regulator [Polynucleobacter sp. MWH-Mekk-B1]|uniref:helix-turn-helix domain-containing protein n=1 Tax=Polynucleobacter finlandensis TaxID=1855894 RepID=UPI001C0DD5ED|nr:helix-turn-helix transcriptional regulator [Polynucleobacter finlandensis]MBU3543764.1 helix-turn-helix transcriptional regulator [Polynucleobacter finlandensis]
MPSKETETTNNLIGTRLREARLRANLPQDKLGVLIGLDEGSSSARISRYETGIHEPALATAQKLAEILNLPLCYLYCEDDEMAELILVLHALKKSELQKLLRQYEIPKVS